MEGLLVFMLCCVDSLPAITICCWAPINSVVVRSRASNSCLAFIELTCLVSMRFCVECSMTLKPDLLVYVCLVVVSGGLTEWNALCIGQDSRKCVM